MILSFLVYHYTDIFDKCKEKLKGVKQTGFIFIFRQKIL